jgi:hypothetical protein
MKTLHLSNFIEYTKVGGTHEVVSNFYKYQKLLSQKIHIWYPCCKDDSNSIRINDNIEALQAIELYD